MNLYTLLRSKAFPLILICSIASILIYLTVPMATGSSSTVIFRVEPNITGGVAVDGQVAVDVYIDAPSGSAIIGWTIDVKVDPNVLEPGYWIPIPPPFGSYIVAKSGQAGYFLYDWKNDTKFFEGERNETTGTITTTIETIVAWTELEPGTGANGTGKLGTFYFTSKNETAYSPIEITKAFYYTSWNSPQLDKREPDIIIHGHYNEPTYDVAVTSISAPTVVTAGDIVNINVTVANLEAPAVLNLTLTYDTTIIETRLMSLASETSKTESFTWDTTGLTSGEYVINATAIVRARNTDTWLVIGWRKSFNTTRKPVVPDSEEVYVNETLMTRSTPKTDTWTALGTNNTDAWTGDGVTKSFATTGKPVVPDSEKVYVNQTLMTKPANYTVDYETGNVTFTTAPGLGANVTATYLYLKRSFATTRKPVVPDSEKVYVNQTLMTKPANYTVDYETGNVTFTVAPGVGVEVKAEYSYGHYTISYETGEITFTTELGPGSDVTAIYFSYFSAADDDPTNNFNTTTIKIIEHDVAITSVTSSLTLVRVGELVNITVAVENQGAKPEDFNVAVYANETVIATENVTSLLASDSRTVTFEWNTTYVDPGIYTISANATVLESTFNLLGIDDDLLDNTYTYGTLTVVKLPFANFTYSPEYPAPNQVITFDASLSTPDGGNITSYAWNFGDGNTTTAYDPVITHAYDTVGTYTVTLNVTDGEGLTDTATAQVTVLLHDIAITSVTPLPTTVKIGGPVSINVTVVNEGTEKETFTVTVYYDDTTIGTQTVTELASDASRSLTFNWDTSDVAAETYTIRASATTVPGETDTTDNTFTDGDVTVEEAPATDILLYAAAAGAIAIVIAAAAIYFLKIRKPKPT